MPDKDSIIYKYQNKLESNLAERSLISLERSQKLDLLIHLLANLRKVLIICGPNGIGKTTLLESLQNSRREQWDICRLSGASSLNYETVMIKLCRFLNLPDTRDSVDLAALNAYCERQKVILTIDDAGLLAPGLIDALVGLCESISGLRLVFAMTYDEFHIKVVTDKALEESHSIELPALTEKQCGEYLQNLSAQPGALLTFKEVTESLVAALYRDTHGIPGRILSELPKLNQYQKRSKSRIGLWTGVAFIVLVAGWFMKNLTPSSLLSNNLQQTVAEQQIIAPIALPKVGVPDKVETEKPVSPVLTAEPAPVLPKMPAEEKTSQAIQPVEQAPPMSNPLEAKNAGESNEIVISQPVALKPSASPANIKAVEPLAKRELPAVASPPVQPIKKTPDLKVEAAGAADGNVDWIMTQPAENYTLQVMVLSTKAAAQRFLKKYPAYSDKLKYFVINKSEQQKFVLIYGSFASSAEAKNSKAELPAEFKSSLEKRFKLIQNESRR